MAELGPQLWCILISHGFDHTLGDVFPVEMASEATIAHLKEKIIARKGSQVAHIDPDELAVWKCPGLKLPTDDENDDDLVARINLFKREVQRCRGSRKLSSLGIPLDEMLLAQMPGTYFHSILLYSNELPLP